LKEPGGHGYLGGICGYLYEPANGDQVANIAANMAFEDLPADWVCPIGGTGKDQFTAVV
jgi:rubredoxin